ncbi:MAG: hypothetical protein VKP72_14255 [bacterium]|jgi:hypothetical protein|nr:hypothetical protein [bacterium]
MFTTLEGAFALLVLVVLVTTRPALAHDHASHPDHGVSQAQPSGAPRHPSDLVLLASRVFRFQGHPVAARLYDGRAHFRELHRAHPNHPGIPTHRLELLFSSGQVTSPGSLLLTRPGGQPREVYLYQEGGHWVADLELREPGEVLLTLTGTGGDHASWTCKLLP